MPIDEQKIILNLKNNLEHKPITASDLPGVNRIGLLPDDTIHFEYDPIKVYGKRPDMIYNTGIPTKGLSSDWNNIGLGLAGVMSLPLIMYGGEVATASELPAIGSTLWNGAKTYGGKALSYGRNLLNNGITNKFVRDMLLGSTIGLSADQAVRTFTDYNGIADGMLRSTFGDDIQKNPWYDYMLFGAEFFNPFNLIAPASIASKTNLYRQFDNLGNELINGISIDPINQFKRSLKIKNGPIWTVESENPQDFMRSFLNNPKLGFIDDIGHRVQYVRNYANPHEINVYLGQDDLWKTYIKKRFKLKDVVDHPTKYNIDDLEVAPETNYTPFTSLRSDNNKILLTGNLTDRYSRTNPMLPGIQMALPLTVKQANDLNSYVGGLANRMRLYGGVYLNPFLKQIKFKPGDYLGPRESYAHHDHRAVVTIEPAYYPDGKFSASTTINSPVARFDIPHNGNPTISRLGMSHPHFLVEGMNPVRTARLEPGKQYGNLHIDISQPQVATLSNLSDNPSLLVDENGNINNVGWEALKNNLAQKLGVTVDELDNILNEGNSPLLQHLLSSAYSAQTMPLPKGVTRQQLVLGAFLHDIGRLQYMIGDDAAHANAGASLLKGIHIDGLNDDVLNSINWHASREQLNAFNKRGIMDGINYPLLHAVSAADVSRGLHYVHARDKFPYLFGYEMDESRLPLHLNEEEQMSIVRNYLNQRGYLIDSSLPLVEQWNQLQSIVKQANTFVRGVKSTSGGDAIARDLGITDPRTQERILATTPVRRYNGQRGTYDNQLFGKYIGLNSNDTGMVYVSNDPNYSDAFGNIFTIRRGNASDYVRHNGESPLQYLNRLMPISLDAFSITPSQLTQNKFSLPDTYYPSVDPDVINLYKHFGYTAEDAQLNTYGHKLLGWTSVAPTIVQPGLHITDFPNFRRNIMFVTAPGLNGAFGGPYYKREFHIVPANGEVLSTMKKHGGKICKNNQQTNLNLAEKWKCKKQ